MCNNVSRATDLPIWLIVEYLRLYLILLAIILLMGADVFVGIFLNVRKHKTGTGNTWEGWGTVGSASLVYNLNE